MLRFRIGQSWKRDPEAGPTDSFGLLLDGVNFLPGVSEEPLARVVPDLVEAIRHLGIEGGTTAQVSLSEAHVELGFHRMGADVKLWAICLGRPAGLVRPPVRVDLPELVDATVRVANAMIADLSAHAPRVLRDRRHRAMARSLRLLEGSPLTVTPARSDQGGLGYHRSLRGPVSIGFTLADEDGLLHAAGARADAPLVCLMQPGSVVLRADALGPPLEAPGIPFLLALELARQANELAHALEVGDEAFEVRLPPLHLHLDLRQQADLARVLLRQMYDLGNELTFALSNLARATAKNPHVLQLAERCREGLASLREAVDPGPEETGAATREAQRTGQQRPLRGPGRLRRLRYEALWQKTNLGGDEVGRLWLSGRGPIVASSEVSVAFTRRGKLWFRRMATHGVATSRDGVVVLASLDRLAGFHGSETSARWIRDHDGGHLGPQLLRRDGVLLMPIGASGALALSELTGRELWRIDPPRTHRAHLSLQGQRVLLTTDAGTLYGLDLLDGQVRFRMRAALPFVDPPVPVGRRLLTALSRGEQSAVLVADAHSGSIGWTRELPLVAPLRPLAVRGRVYVGGRQDDHEVLVCLGRTGATLWERRLHLRHPLAGLTAVGSAVLAHDRAGAACLVGPDGNVEWRVGAAGDELLSRVAVQRSRGLLIIPGELIRAVEPRGGRVLAEVPAPEGLVDVKVDSQLTMYCLNEDGALKALRLTSHFAVV